MSGQGVSKKRRNLPSRFRNGNAIANADGRRRDIRAVRDGVRAILADGGGEDAASFLRRRVATRAMFLDGVLSADELALVQGQEIDRATYTKNAQVWLKYVSQLGLQRVAKPAEDLRQYLKRVAAEDQSGGRSVP